MRFQRIGGLFQSKFLSEPLLLSNEKKVRILNVLDECSPKVLLCFAATSIKGRKLVKVLKELIKTQPPYLGDLFKQSKNKYKNKEVKYLKIFWESSPKTLKVSKNLTQE